MATRPTAQAAPQIDDWEDVSDWEDTAGDFTDTPQVGRVPSTPAEIQALHHHNQMMGQAQDVEGGSSMRVPTVGWGQGAYVPGIGRLPKFSMGTISTRPQDIAPVIGAIPRALGTIGGATPLGRASIGAFGDLAGQGIEWAGGARESINPYETLAVAGANAIPGGWMAKTLKPETQLGTRAMGAAEGALTGATATGAGAAAQGRFPDPAELGIGAAIGGGLGGASAQRQAQPRSDYTDKAHKQLYAAIQPEAGDTREFSEHLTAAMPYIYANRRGHVNGIGDFEQAAKGTMKRLWNLHIEPVVAMNSHMPRDTSPIAQALKAKITPDTPKAVRKAIQTEAEKFMGERSLGDINRLLKEQNAVTRGLQEASGKSARTLRTDPKTAWRFDHLNQLRSTVADAAGDITGDSAMYMKLRKDWGALSEVADDAEHAAKRWEHQQKIEQAHIMPGAQRVIKSVKGGLGFGGQAAVRRGATEMVAEYMSNPDRMVKGAFKKLRFGQRMSEQFPEPNLGPERKMLPAMGETGEPSIGDLSNRLPEDWRAAKEAKARAEGRRTLPGTTYQEGRVGYADTPPVQGQTVPITVAPVPNPWMGAERRRSVLTPEEAAQEQAIRLSDRFVERRRNQEAGDWLENNMDLPEAGRWVRGYKPSAKYTK